MITLVKSTAAYLSTCIPAQVDTAASEECHTCPDVRKYLIISYSIFLMATVK